MTERPLSSVIVCATRDAGEYLSRACSATGHMNVYEVLEAPVRFQQIVRLANALNPEVFFVELDACGRPAVDPSDIRAVSQEAWVIAFCQDPEVKWTALGSRFAAVVVAPFEPELIEAAISRAIQTSQSLQRKQTLAFQPARGGSGATTIALNFSANLARRALKVLMIELDFFSRPLSAILGLKPRHSVSEALREHRWSEPISFDEIVVQRHGIDFLLASSHLDLEQASAWNCRRLLASVLSSYEAVIVDLPDAVNDITEAVVSTATETYIVCTPDAATLSLAGRRMENLLKPGWVHPAKLGLILNQCQAAELDLEEAERALPIRPIVAIQADISDMRRAASNGGLVSEDSAVGRACLDLSERWSGHKRAPTLQAPSIRKAPTPLTGLKELFGQLLHGHPTGA